MSPFGNTVFFQVKHSVLTLLSSIKVSGTLLSCFLRKCKDSFRQIKGKNSSCGTTVYIPSRYYCTKRNRQKHKTLTGLCVCWVWVEEFINYCNQENHAFKYPATPLCGLRTYNVDGKLKDLYTSNCSL
jgi:hypothetical protein